MKAKSGRVSPELPVKGGDRLGSVLWRWCLLGWLALGARMAWGVEVPEAKPADWVVATYNVLYRNTNLTQLVQTIQKLDASLVCLQETTPRIEKHLRENLQTLYPYQIYQSARGSGGLAILSRTPLLEVEYLPPEPEIRGALVARVEPFGPGRAVEFASVHLRTPQVFKDVPLPAALALFQQVGEAQEREIRRIWQKFKRTGPRLVMGDFNSFSFGPAQVYLKNEGLQDSFAMVQTKPDEVPTWRGHGLGLGVAFRIDYLFHSSHFRTLDSRVMSEGSSDHFPVVSRLQLRPESPAAPAP